MACVCAAHDSMNRERVRHDVTDVSEMTSLIKSALRAHTHNPSKLAKLKRTLNVYVYAKRRRNIQQKLQQKQSG